MNVERNIARIDSSSNSQRLEHISHQSSIGSLPAAYAGISALAGVLTLITASECGSVLHLGSMLYGAVLWGGGLSLLAHSGEPVSAATVKRSSPHYAKADTTCCSSTSRCLAATALRSSNRQSRRGCRQRSSLPRIITMLCKPLRYRRSTISRSPLSRSGSSPHCAASASASRIMPPSRHMSNSRPRLLCFDRRISAGCHRRNRATH